MAARTEKTKYPNIYRAHGASCAWHDGEACECKPTYEAGVYLKREKKLARKRFDTLRAARQWREDAAGAVRAGKLRAQSATRVEQAAAAYLVGMRDGSILDRSGKPYKPATCRSYDRSLRLRVLPVLGDVRLSELRRRDVQDLVDALRADGKSPSTIHNTLDPLRAIYRRAIRRDEVVIDPTHGLELPAVRSHRDRTAAPAEAEALIEALPESEQALWTTAIYCGMRRGELQALRWSDVDLEGGIVSIERAYDDEGGSVIETKTTAGVRMVPVTARVRKRLIAHKLRTGRDGAELVFGRTATERFVPSTVRSRAQRAWKAAGLESIKLHEGRHSAATAGSAAGLDDLSLSYVMGHSSVVITKDRYGHVRPDRVAEVGKLLDAYYERGGRS